MRRTRERGDVPHTPVEEEVALRQRKTATIAGTLLLTAGVLLWSELVLAVPVDYPDLADHFKYGSIGSDLDNGIPYWIWKVMPAMFSEHVAARGDGSSSGYEAFGFLVEPGMDRPIGFSKRRSNGIELVGLNCAVCHVGSVRGDEHAGSELVLGMPAHQLDLLAYFEFLFDCAKDPRFTVNNVMAAIDQQTELSVFERFVYRQAVPQLREVLLARAGLLQPLSNARFRSGKGRIDTFNPYKAMVLNFPEVDRAAPGASDFPSLWNQRPRQKMHLHWDGNNDSLFERNISAAIGAGVTPVSVDLPRILRLAEWIQDLPPPRHDAFAAHREARAEEAGHALYVAQCQDCHGDPQRSWQSRYVGQVEPLARIGTDRNRLDSYTYLFASSQWTIGSGRPWRFNHFRKTDGYANAPLDGLWARAPYLHNGSVPTLRDLLSPPPAQDQLEARRERAKRLLEGTPEQVAQRVGASIATARQEGQRPLVFYRGDDLLDVSNVGLRVDRAADGAHRFYLHDTTQDGASNSGHDYGTQLPAAQKEQLLAYLKTL